MPPPTLQQILENCGRLDCLPLFEEQDITAEQLPSLTIEDLKEIGIQKLGHRKAIFSAIQAAHTAHVPQSAGSPAQRSVSSGNVASPAPQDSQESINRPKVFLSYGRKDSLEVAKRLEQDLEAAGFEVWMDIKKIGSGSLWQQEIENGLREAQVVVSLLSPHAVRRAGDSDPMDSVCLDEITFARTSSPPTPVVPAMVAPCEPPFIIYRLDYVHLMGWQDSEEAYRKGFERLVSGIHEAVVGKVRYRLWEDRLRPMDFSDYMAQKRMGFVGREWLFEEIDLWRFESNERALLITGDPGAGKSSIVAQLVHTNPDGQVIGYHCCQSNELDTLRPSRFVQSLAAMIASRIPAYAEQLDVPSVREALDDRRCEADAGGAFLEGIIQPLQKLATPDEGVRYILVDALDEALSHAGTTSIVDVLAGRLDRLPTWLRIVATTRNEPAVVQRLSGLRAKSIDASDPRNLQDLDDYIRQRLLDPSLAERLVLSGISSPAAVESISRKSSGNFLYAVNALEGIARDLYSFENLTALPGGLDGLYLDFFRRIFGREGTEACDLAYARAQPLLQVLCAAAEPLSRSELAAASGLDLEDDLPRLLRQLAQLLRRGNRPTDEETVAFYHKSVADWLVVNPDANPYFVSPSKGRKLLASFCLSSLSTNRALGWYVRRHAVEHFLDVEDWDSASITLSNLEFIEARAVARELPAMLKDYARAEELFPDGEKERQLEVARRTELERYTRKKLEYARNFWFIQHGSSAGSFSLPHPVKSVRLWSSEEISAARKRMIDAPNRLDILKAFKVFVATNAAALQENSKHEGFVGDLATNSAPAGPVHEAGKRRVEHSACTVFAKRFAVDEPYDPLPSCRGVFEGHASMVYSVALSTDGRRVVSGSADATVRIWDSETGECLQVLQGHTDSVFSVKLSLDGRRVVSASKDKTVRIWDLETGICSQVLAIDGPAARCVAISDNGTRVVSGGGESPLTLLVDCNLNPTNLDPSAWIRSSGFEVLRQKDQKTGSEATSEEMPKDCAADDTVQPATVTESVADEGPPQDPNAIRVWDTETGECVATLCGHEDTVLAVALSGDGRRIVSGSLDKTIRVWDAETGECVATLGGHEGAVRAVALSDDGRRIVSGSWDKTIRVWDAEMGECLRAIQKPTASVNSVALSADGKLIVSASGSLLEADKKVEVWDANTGECLRAFEGHGLPVVCVAITPDGAGVVSGGHDAQLRTWEIEKSGNLHPSAVNINNGALADSVAKTDHSDARTYVARLWLNRAANELVYAKKAKSVGESGVSCEIWVSRFDESVPTKKIIDHEAGPTECLYLSPISRHVVSAHADNKVRISDLVSGRCLRVLDGHDAFVSSLSVSTTERHVYSGSWDNTIRLWDYESGECLRILKGHAGVVTSLGIHVRGGLLVSGSDDRTIRLWDIETGDCLKTLAGHEAEITSLVLSANGRRIVSGSQDCSVRVWDSVSGECLRTLQDHVEKVWEVCLSPDDGLIFSRCANAIRIWRASSTECIGIMHARGVSSFCMDWKNRKMFTSRFDQVRLDAFQLENLPLGPLVTTAQREILSEDLPAGPVIVRPACCGAPISVPVSVIDRIEKWENEGDGGSDTDPALLLECPHCQTPLRMNPFFAEVRLLSN
jgi:WD40 repeat protein